MNICIHGHGFNAFVATACLAEYGNQIVFCYDKNLYENTTYYWLDSEPGLKKRFDKNLAEQRIVMDSTIPDDVLVHWLFCENDEEVFNTYIVDILTKSKLSNHENLQIILSSQHPIGFYDELNTQVSLYCIEHSINLPELTLVPRSGREGLALSDFEYPELLLVGRENKPSAALQQLLSPFIAQSKKTMFVSGTSAELIRASTRAMLATRLSFMNEIASVADRLGVDIHEVRDAMASDSRIGSQYLSPGCGFGGVTLAEELNNLNQQILEQGTGTQLLSSVNKTNELQKELLFRKFWQFYNAQVAGKTVAIWGAAFKPGSSSLKNSPIHVLLKAFWAQGVATKVYDPKAGQALNDFYHDEPLLSVVNSAQDALPCADALLVVTNWKEFYSPDFNGMKASMNRAVIFDGRNIYDPAIVKQCGIEYFGIGRK